MKKLFSVIIIISMFLSKIVAQQYVDVVYLKNGSIIRGIILEQIPNQTIKIQTADKSLFVYKMDEVEKILKEETKNTNANTYSDGTNDESSSVTFSLKGGLILTGPGKVNIAGKEFSPKTSPTLKADLDGILVPKLSMGLSAIVGLLGIEKYSKSSTYLSVGGTIKPRFMLTDELQIRPGLFVGYNYIKNDDMSNNSNGLNIGGQLELSKYLQSGYAFVGEFGFISQPVGGTGKYEISFPPIFYILFGIQFGK